MDKNIPHTEHFEEGNLLNSIPKKEFYQAPEGYFEAFDRELMDRIRMAPLFYSLEKPEEPAIPLAYAEEAHARVMAAVTKVHKKGKVVPLYKQMMRWTAVAAALALLFTVGYYAIYTGNHQQVHQTVAENAAVNLDDEYRQYLQRELNMDDAIAYYVNSESVPAAENAELDYLMEEELDIENY